ASGPGGTRVPPPPVTLRGPPYLGRVGDPGQRVTRRGAASPAAVGSWRLPYPGAGPLTCRQCHGDDGAPTREGEHCDRPAHHDVVASHRPRRAGVGTAVGMARLAASAAGAADLLPRA